MGRKTHQSACYRHGFDSIWRQYDKCHAHFTHHRLYTFSLRSKPVIHNKVFSHAVGTHRLPEETCAEHVLSIGTCERHGIDNSNMVFLICNSNSTTNWPYMWNVKVICRNLWGNTKDKQTNGAKRPLKKCCVTKSLRQEDIFFHNVCTSRVNYFPLL